MLLCDHFTFVGTALVCSIIWHLTGALPVDHGDLKTNDGDEDHKDSISAAVSHGSVDLLPEAPMIVQKDTEGDGWKDFISLPYVNVDTSSRAANGTTVDGGEFAGVTPFFWGGSDDETDTTTTQASKQSGGDLGNGVIGTTVSPNVEHPSNFNSTVVPNDFDATIAAAPEANDTVTVSVDSDQGNTTTSGQTAADTDSINQHNTTDSDIVKAVVPVSIPPINETVSTAPDVNGTAQVSVDYDRANSTASGIGKDSLDVQTVNDSTPDKSEESLDSTLVSDKNPTTVNVNITVNPVETSVNVTDRPSLPQPANNTDLDSDESDGGDFQSSSESSEGTSDKDPSEGSNDNDPSEGSTENDPSEGTTDNDPSEGSTDNDPSEGSGLDSVDFDSQEPGRTSTQPSKPLILLKNPLDFAFYGKWDDWKDDASTAEGSGGAFPSYEDYEEVGDPNVRQVVGLKIPMLDDLRNEFPLRPARPSIGFSVTGKNNQSTVIPFQDGKSLSDGMNVVPENPDADGAAAASILGFVPSAGSGEGGADGDEIVTVFLNLRTGKIVGSTLKAWEKTGHDVILPLLSKKRRLALLIPRRRCFALAVAGLFLLWNIFTRDSEETVNVKNHEANYESSPIEFTAPNLAGFTTNVTGAGFDVGLSDRTSLQRRLPEVRHLSCLGKTYALAPTSISVTIVFHNEPLSTLLRTVWSVINRTKPKFLLEIILVDDGSEGLTPEFQQLIDREFQLFKQSAGIRFIQFRKNLGLIKARLAGAEHSKGDVLVFLDSHCEVNVGWLEPLLAVIQRDRKTFACPIVDTISFETIAYKPIDGFRATGLFSWSMYFAWGRRPDRDTQVTDKSLPFKTATFPGGLFAVDRAWFFQVGSYDVDMDGWGGENLEMSFRVWMCHGSIVFVPCSRVGHLSRVQEQTDKNKSVPSMDKNIVRLVDVWLDEYSRFFYLARPDLKGMDAGNLADRKALRSKLQCQSFGWYLKNVATTKTVPDENVQAWGQIKHRALELCITVTGYDENEAYPYVLRPCVHTGSIEYILQLFSLGKDGHLRREEWCVGEKNSSTGARSTIQSEHCDEEPAATWVVEGDSALRHTDSGKCLAADRHTTEIFLTQCQAGSAEQNWKFEHRHL
ncbi:putative N-acetylgalactosaminyltransferase 9 [Hypsibius exemplaris]|uniref:N-acetylgalactosaminyltransferase 9 n=1 Tax=Hypsibius exemplaris TaxID=2072580 RepID=A0A1W0WJ35_HYPEX|nr:putative N-acetylgalactosaminyltransferase 9 [Hypsibius exemplaris]